MKPIRNQAIFLSFLAISVLVTGGHFYLDTASAKADFHISHQFDVPQVSSYSYKETSHTTYQGKPRQVTHYVQGPKTISAHSLVIQPDFSVGNPAAQNAIKAGTAIQLKTSKAALATYTFKVKSGHRAAIFFYPRMMKTTGTLINKSEGYGYTIKKKVVARGPVLLSTGEADGTYKLVYKK